jgi:hypothetical protein
MLPLLIGTTDTTCIGCYNNVGVAYANAYEHATSEQLTSDNAATLAWAPWVWLPLSTTVGLSTVTGHDLSLLPRDYVPYDVNSDTLGRYGTAQKSSTVKTLSLQTTIPGWHGRLQTAMGFNVYSQSSHDIIASQDSLSFGVDFPATLNEPTSQDMTGTTTFGWFFEPRFTLSERLFLTPGFRLDGGNANGDRATVSGLPAKLTFAALFPKINLSYVAIDRSSDDRPLFGFLTLLRPRVAFGQAGLQPTAGQQLRLLAVNRSGGDTLRISSLGNTQLRPERSSEVEAGVDAEMWNGRLSVTVTGSRQMRHDAILSVPIAPSVLGSNQSIALNVGEVRNRSIELSMSMRPIETEAVSWAIGGNLSHNDNVVLRLDRNSTALLQSAGANSVLTSADTKVAVGYPLFGRWVSPIIGYSDANDDGVIEPQEIRLGDTTVYLGRQDPAYTAAFTTDLMLLHGRLGLHANFARLGGYSQLNGASGVSGTFLSTANDPNATLGQQAAYVAAAYHLSDYGLVQTVSEWQFQSLSINYVVPTSIAQRFHARTMSIALQGSNLGLWTNYRGKDPNVNAFPNGNAVADGGQLPMPRSWQLKCTLGN